MRFVVTGDSEDDCWRWTGSKKPRGYGRIRIGYVEHIASRLSWAIHNGRDPGELDVCHTCDNPECANPRHLFLGTKSANLQDAADKGKGLGFRSRPLDNSGEKNPMAKLSDAAVSDIRTLCGQGMSQRKVGAIFGVKQQAVSKIMNGLRRRAAESALGSLAPKRQHG